MDALQCPLFHTSSSARFNLAWNFSLSPSPKPSAGSRPGTLQQTLLVQTSRMLRRCCCKRRESIESMPSGHMIMTRWNAFNARFNLAWNFSLSPSPKPSAGSRPGTLQQTLLVQTSRMLRRCCCKRRESIESMPSGHMIMTRWNAFNARFNLAWNFSLSPSPKPSAGSRPDTLQQTLLVQTSRMLRRCCCKRRESIESMPSGHMIMTRWNAFNARFNLAWNFSLSPSPKPSAGSRPDTLQQTLLVQTSRMLRRCCCKRRESIESMPSGHMIMTRWNAFNARFNLAWNFSLSPSPKPSAGSRPDTLQQTLLVQTSRMLRRCCCKRRESFESIPSII